MTTIFAPITNSSNCAVCVIRISGEKSLWSLEKFGVKKLPKANEIKFTKIFDPKNNQIIDDVLVAYFQAPKSFTGQDVVEISCHSSNFVIKKILEILGEFEDFRFAKNGEFAKMAVLNNKIDLIQAEAIIDLINSQTEIQHRQAIKQLQGDLSNIYNLWRNEIIEILALIESVIDFPDEDLPREIVEIANKKVAKLIIEISNHLNDGKKGQKIKDGFSLVIIGAPNVGKSTLLNFLAKSEVAIVSNIAGTTRDIIEIHLDIAGFAVKIADSAGIRNSKNEIEQEGIKRAIKKAKNADLIIELFDCDSQNVDFEGFEDKNILKVLNKIDLEKSVSDKNFDVAISLKENKNLDIFFEKLEEKVKKLAPNQCENYITQERYRISLSNALKSLQNFSFEKNIEICAEDLRIAAFEIAAISGNINVDDILDVIFTKFCIGK